MHNTRAILLIIAAMACFTVEDALIKTLSATVPVGEVLICLAIGGAFTFGLWAVLRGDRIFAPRNWRPKPVIRAMTEGGAALTFATALSLVDISVVGAVFQSMPLAVTLGAALFLNETVGWRRWLAIGIGFVGVLMIIRPGLSGFDINTLWVLAAVVMIATRDLMTRVLDTAIPSSVISFQAFLMVIPAGAFKLWLTGDALVTPTSVETVQLIGAVIAGVVGYACIVSGMRMGDASAVTPFRYTRLVFSMIAGALIFGERPDLMTYLGSGVILASGFYAFTRERKRMREILGAA